MPRITTAIPTGTQIHGFKDEATLKEQIFCLTIGDYDDVEDRDRKLEKASGDFWVDGTQLDYQRLHDVACVALWFLSKRVHLFVYVTEKQKDDYMWRWQPRRADSSKLMHDCHA